MGEATIALLGVVVGAFTAVFGSVANGMFSYRSERRERIRTLLAVLLRSAGAIDRNVALDRQRLAVKTASDSEVASRIRSQMEEALISAHEPLGMLELEPIPLAPRVVAAFSKMTDQALIVNTVTRLYIAGRSDDIDGFELITKGHVEDTLATYTELRATFRRQARELWADAERLQWWPQRRAKAIDAESL